MKPFNSTVYVDGETLEFTFYNIHTVKGEKFFVTVTRYTRPYIFDMIKSDSTNWLIIEPAPQWVKPLEGQLANIIAQNV